MDDLKDLYQQMILDHNQNPQNFREMENATSKAEGHNPLCGDELTLFLHVENEMITDVSFLGSGCAISKASASIMTTLIKDKTISEAETLFEQFHSIITTGKSNGDMGKLAVLAGVYKFPSRVKCAVLSWHTMNNALHGNTNLTTTE
ncbi:MAG: SUF system NifU family Fe-S cluster assembly protein [Candidatus Marinimicrobia bacterium]|jgi:nitrogen fixation NifU-like protein|nr:SUF system NifU family Fe-S cluster assembly protein [Candidatus Neomarinimicrobiota bacterium]MDP6500673.1 SUF system NifU family Fe-S cluster assembly protein [Candidatus Neomarinimicrobiota bacterium]MDP6726673.1 SUF system NifU family Fe-S cluster assembly protein [Candidatus Neomarinimicrobiota bacterium]|tara:strand:+ start:12954 stop:13394 length:441 start_codon:yes stop_codon:yes gene_type:complete